jgi:hypothetical protein
MRCQGSGQRSSVWARFKALKKGRRCSGGSVAHLEHAGINGEVGDGLSRQNRQL